MVAMPMRVRWTVSEDRMEILLSHSLSPTTEHMRKLLSLSFMGYLLLASCGGPMPDPNMDKEASNKKAFEKIMSAWDSGDSAIFDSLIADNFVEHNPDPMIKSTGRQHWKDMMKMYRGQFPDMKGKPQVITADGDWVTSVATVSGTQTGMMMGKPGSGHSLTDVTGTRRFGATVHILNLSAPVIEKINR